MTIVMFASTVRRHDVFSSHWSSSASALSSCSSPSCLSCESGKMTIVMHANKQPDAELQAEMTRYYHRDGEEEDCSDYTTV